MKRYPRPCTVSMKRGVWAASPSALRNSRTEWAGIESLTDTSGQMASSNAALVTNSPGCSTKCRRTAKVLRRRRISRLPRHNCSLFESSRKGGKWRKSTSTINRLSRIKS
jgi:hypothetical protein